MSSAQFSYLDGKVTLHVGDLTQHAVDVIVNTANSSLMGGGGVDGAIHRTGGPKLTEACRLLRATSHPDGLPTGNAVMTPGGNLAAKFVIHTVGPVYGRHGGKEAELLACCYLNSLALAMQHGLSSIAFPSISTGAYGYPQPEAAEVVSQALNRSDFPGDIRLVFFDQRQLAIFVAHQEFRLM
jgi:O-acetyl-ADP-ribose deacetylase (regulator of RNase III)